MDCSVSGKRIQIYESLLGEKEAEEAAEAAEGGYPEESPYG